MQSFELQKGLIKMKQRNKTIKMLKGEKILYFLLVLAIILFPISTVLSKAILSETNITLEQMKTRVNTQEGINESLSMQVDELASLDKIQEVAESKGMTYNNNNIKNINE